MLKEFEVNMKPYVIVLKKEEDLELILKLPFRQVIVEPRILSKLGNIPLQKLASLLQKLKEKQIHVSLQSDVLCDEAKFKQHTALLKSAICLGFDAVRFLDPGIGAWIMETFPEQKIHCLLDRHSRNIKAIQHWVEVFKPNLERIVLSNEIPHLKLAEIKESVDVETELLGLGQLEVFYSPRSLIKPYFTATEEETIEVHGHSEDRPSQDIPLAESVAGTFMFNDKDLSILQSKAEIKESKLDYIRIELYQSEQFELILEALKSENWQDVLLESWTRKTTRGFFRTNKTDAPFKRLTNQSLRKYQEQKLGIVLESKKNSHCVIQLNHEIQCPAEFSFMNPEGRKITKKIDSIESVLGEKFSVEDSLKAGLYVIPWQKHIQSSSIVFIED